MFMYFVFGVFVHENKIGRILTEYSNTKNAIVSALFIILEAMYLSIAEENLAGTLLEVVLSFVGIAFIVNWSQVISKSISAGRSSLLLSVAASSYVIYLFHTTFEGMAKAVIHKLPFDSSIWYVFTTEALVVVLLGIVCPMGVYYVAKRFAVSRFLLGLKR